MDMYGDKLKIYLHNTIMHSGKTYKNKGEQYPFQDNFVKESKAKY